MVIYTALALFSPSSRNEPKIYIYRTCNFNIFTIIQQDYFWYLISSVAQYVKKQKQQNIINPLIYISITVIETSKKRTKSTEEANNCTKIKISHKSNSLYLHQWSYRCSKPHRAQNSRKRHSSCVVPLAWIIALCIVSNILYRSLQKTENSQRHH